MPAPRLMQNILVPQRSRAAKWREVDGCRLISPIAAVSCSLLLPSYIDSPYSPPPPRATATFLRGLLINGESINGGLRGIPKKSQRGRGEWMDPPESCNEEEISFSFKRKNENAIATFDCSLNSLARKEIKIRLLVCLFRDDE